MEFLKSLNNITLILYRILFSSSYIILIEIQNNNYTKNMRVLLSENSFIRTVMFPHYFGYWRFHCNPNYSKY